MKSIEQRREEAWAPLLDHLYRDVEYYNEHTNGAFNEGIDAVITFLATEGYVPKDAYIRNDTQQRALEEIECTLCGALRYYPCRNTDGTEVPGIHPVRVVTLVRQTREEMTG